MDNLYIIFLASLALGQIGAISITSGVTLYAHDIVLACILCISLFRKKLPFFSCRLFWPIICFFVVSIISVICSFSYLPYLSTLKGSLYLIRWIFYASIYVIVSKESHSVRAWMVGLFFTGVTFAGIGLIQYFCYPDLRNLYYLGWDPHFMRVFSTLFEPNYLGIILVLTMYIGVYLIQIQGKRQLLFALAMCVVASAFLLTYSRSSFIAFIVGISVWMVLHWKNQIQKAVIYGLCTIVLFCLFIVALPKSEGEGTKILRSASSIARIGSWERGISLIREKPVFGFGFNMLKYVQKAKGWVNEEKIANRAATGLDNSLLFVASSTGLVGLTAYLFLIYSTFSLLKKSVKEKYFVIFKELYLASLIALLIHSFFVNSLFYPWVLIWLWILAGCAEKISKN